MYRLEAFERSKDLQQFHVETYVPPTKKPHVRTERSKPNEMDIYGFRPLQHPWKLLSPYEFLMAWRAEPLMVPSYYANKNVKPLTEWTFQGLELIKNQAYKDGEVAAKPGVDYIVIERDDNVYHTFPKEPREYYSTFRHAWILIRKKRPDVVVIEGLKLPSTARSDAENAKYCSLFFRPWTLLPGGVYVPHLSLLGVSTKILQQVYETSAAHESSLQVEGQSHCVQNIITWHRTWDTYIRGQVVSRTASELIKSFLLKH